MSFTEILVALCNSMEFKAIDWEIYDNSDRESYYKDSTTDLIDYVETNVDSTEKTVAEFESIFNGTIYIAPRVVGTSYQVTYKLYKDANPTPITSTQTYGSIATFKPIEIEAGHKYKLTITTVSYDCTMRTYLKGKLGLKANPKLLFHEITE